MSADLASQSVVLRQPEPEAGTWCVWGVPRAPLLWGAPGGREEWWGNTREGCQDQKLGTVHAKLKI